MNKIICPNCKKEFEIQDSDYVSIMKQIKDDTFNQEIKRYEDQLRQEAGNALKLRLSEKDRELEKMRFEIEKNETAKELAITKAIQEKDKDLADKDQTIFVLKNALSQQKLDNENRLKEKDELISFYKDLKTKMSTKMLGETLEQHCQIEFNKIRATAFKNAYFEKDNDATSGSKGDYIFREKTDNGVEILSIMFEMKNEMETTSTKHKNEDFFKELDKDRNEKHCEYAVLVSMLEADNELYNSGIVDVSYRYPKMYVIRPQFFIPMITTLRNASLNAIEYKEQLEISKNKDLDILNFEEEMQKFKDNFGRNYRIAKERFQSAIEEIDKSINHLQKIKDALLSSENNLRLANEKAEDLSIRKLTKNSPYLREQFENNQKDD